MVHPLTPTGLSICTQYDLSADDFGVQFDAWRYSRGLKKQPTLAELDHLSGQIGEKIEAERRRASSKPTGGIRVKLEGRSTTAGLVRPTPGASASFDHASLLGSRGTAGGDDMDDLFADEIVVKKEMVDESMTESTPTKRKIASVSGNDDESASNGDEGDDAIDGSARKRLHRDGEDVDMTSPSDFVDPSVATPSEAAQAASQILRPFRPSFGLLARRPDGQRNEALYPKALGKYVTRENAGQHATALNTDIAGLEPSESQLTTHVDEGLIALAFGLFE